MVSVPSAISAHQAYQDFRRAIDETGCIKFCKGVAKAIAIFIRLIAEIIVFALSIPIILVACCMKKRIIKKLILPAVENIIYIPHPIYFKSSDGVCLEGVYHRGTTNPDIVVICSTGNMMSAQSILPHIKKMGCSIFAYNRRGVGGSEGFPWNPADLRRDAGAALDYVVSKNGRIKAKPENIKAFGYSMGGHEALSLAKYAKAKYKVDISFVMDATFTNLIDVVHAHLDVRENSCHILPKFGLKFITYCVLKIIGWGSVDNTRLISGLKKERCFIISRADDEVILPRIVMRDPQGKEHLVSPGAQLAYPGAKPDLILPNASHCGFPLHAPQIQEFFQKAIRPLS